MYVTERLVLNKKFPALKQEYYVEYVPLAWLPLDVVGQIQRAQVKAKALQSAAVEGDDADMGAISTMMYEVLAPIVADWNLDDREGALIPIPAKSRAALGSVPLTVLEYIIEIATGGVDTEIPLASAPA